MLDLDSLMPILISFLLSFGLTPILILLGKKFKFESVVDFRRKKSIPLLGGLAVYFSLWISSLLFSVDPLFTTLLLLSLPLVIIGALDDIIEFSSKPKFLIQVLSVSLFFAVVPKSQIILFQLPLSDPIVYFVSGFWMLGIINAVNMIDGMDGESSGFAIVAALTMASMSNSDSYSLFLFMFSASLFGFFLYNKPPAKIYIGDAGSTLLGFMLSALSLVIPLSQLTPLSFLLPLFIFSFPGVDALLAMARRMKNKSSLFKGDHDHIHHKLQKIGLSTKWSLKVIIATSLYTCFSALLISQQPSIKQQIAIALLAIPGPIAVLAWIYYLEYKLGLQVSVYSKNLLNNYLNIETKTIIPRGQFRVTIYDLMPYYKELQKTGILKVHEFIKYFSSFIDENHSQSRKYVSGSYTLVIVENYFIDEASKDLSILTSEKELTAKYTETLKYFKILKNDSGNPWGLRFYLNQSKAEELFEKYGLSFSEEQVEIKSNEAS